MIFIGSGALAGKMLLVRIVENNKIDAYLRAAQVKLGSAPGPIFREFYIDAQNLKTRHNGRLYF